MTVIRPTLSLQFARARRLDPRITYTRASTKTFVGIDGLLKTVQVNEPAFDHDPLTGECLGLLIEEARTNLLTYSQDLSHSSWAKNEVTINADAILAPDGTTTADKVVETTANDNHRIAKTYTADGTSQYVFSFFVKAAERTLFYLSLTGIAGTRNIRFNAATKTFSSIGADILSYDYKEYLDGWFRIWISALPPAGSQNATLYAFDGSGNATYTGDGTSGFFAWGGQVSTGGVATSYMPTGAATATRSQDVLSMSGVNFSSWYRQDQGTFILDALALKNTLSGTPIYFDINDGTTDNALRIRRGANQFYAYVRTGAVDQVAMQSGSAWTIQRAAISYKENDVVLAVNGAVTNTDTAATIPSVMNSLILGAGFSSGNPMTGYLRSLVYYPQRLSNAQIADLTRAS